MPPARPHLQEDDPFERPSKSDAKRDMDRLQRIGATLSELPANRIARLPASDTLKDALLGLKSLRSHEAIRRQKQFIGKLMRHEDLDALLAAANGSRQAMSERKIQQWSQRFLTQGEEVIGEFLRCFPHAERHTLRQLLRNAIAEASAEATATTASHHPHQARLQQYLGEVVFLHDA